MRRTSLALVHGGLYEPMEAAAFWSDTGVVRALVDRGVDVYTPQRLSTPLSWEQDADHVAEQLRSWSAVSLPVVGGSNGCSTASRLAVAHPGLVQRIAFCWPVTVDQDDGERRSLANRISRRSGDRATAALLGGETLRGVRDGELATLPRPVAVMASEPENPVHRRSTAKALLRLSTDPIELPPMPEPPIAGFEPERFADAIIRWLAADGAAD